MMDKSIPSSQSGDGVIVLGDLLQCLVECSEKSAKIAQIFREENELFNLLVQEKGQLESNKRFVQDFKTLADVLVQETIKVDVGKKFPQLVPHVQGEEQNSFRNAKGESVDVILTDSADKTASMLSKVLDGRKNLARAISHVVHSTDITCERQCLAPDTHPMDRLAIWIDPIDSTAEFIEGKDDETGVDGMPLSGLKCVSVLIGAYDRETGESVLGVVNQPFHTRVLHTEKWKSKFHWGMNCGQSSCVSPSVHELNESSEDGTQEKDGVVLRSFTESLPLQEIIERKYKLVRSAGAGHKALLVAVRMADLYVLSKSSTYFWDTCAPHAVLNAVGGGMLRLKEAVNDCAELDLEFLKKWQIRYKALSSKTGTEAFQNVDGILAYRNPNVALDFLRFLKNSGYIVP